MTAISNPFLLAVGQLPQVVEKEENSTFELAQAIPEPPLVVEGRVAGNDVDYFRFRGRKGQRIVVDAQCGTDRLGDRPDDPPDDRRRPGAPTSPRPTTRRDCLTDARLTAVLPEDSRLHRRDLGHAIRRAPAGPCIGWSSASVPMAEEVYPLGGRAGETVGLELRGGTSPGSAIAAATMRADFGRRSLPSRGSRAAWPA